jgi:hypothetical protein
MFRVSCNLVSEVALMFLSVIFEVGGVSFVLSERTEKGRTKWRSHNVFVKQRSQATFTIWSPKSKTTLARKPFRAPCFEHLNKMDIATFLSHFVQAIAIVCTGDRKTMFAQPCHA